ncbi:hypothetical protein EDB94_2814 [Marinobacter sp. 3-2]|uniref:Uncharacterized protein n=1 Tax=Marinobacter similis TaxID=1420916 RepID=W5YL04_9GAMM|nr:hypothetical protein AU14_00045 [Marinobacter similis]ROQ43358.1 hypothetical protein EDB94_2814 [Marinobacter sp. 3-2]
MPEVLALVWVIPSQSAALMLVFAASVFATPASL